MSPKGDFDLISSSLPNRFTPLNYCWETGMTSKPFEKSQNILFYNPFEYLIHLEKFDFLPQIMIFALNWSFSANEPKGPFWPDFTFTPETIYTSQILLGAWNGFYTFQKVPKHPILPPIWIRGYHYKIPPPKQKVYPKIAKTTPK